MIEQWWFQVDGRAPELVLNVTDRDEARALLEALPLGGAWLMTFELIALRPLRPLAVLLD